MPSPHRNPSANSAATQSESARDPWSPGRETDRRSQRRPRTELQEPGRDPRVSTTLGAAPALTRLATFGWSSAGLVRPESAI